MVTSVSSENGRILADHTEGLFSVIAWAVNVRNLLCLSHHRCVSAGVVCIATSCSLKSIKKKNNSAKRSAELKSTGRKYTRTQLGKMEANKSVLHLDFIKKEPIFFSFNTIFSGCILIPDAFGGIWAFCKSGAFQSSCLWHRSKIGYINLS